MALDRTRRLMRRQYQVSLLAVGITLIIAVVIAALVPWDTSIRYDRVSRSLDVPLLVLLLPPFAAFLGRNGKRPDTPIPTWQFWAGGVWPIFCVAGQIVLAQSFLAAAASVG